MNIKEMAKLAEPDLTIWGTVIPNLGWSNIAREIWLDAKLNPNVPAFAVVLACSTSMTASFAAAGMLGGGLNLILVGGSEVMSRPSLALTAEASKRLTDLFAQDPAAALAALGALTPQDYVLPTKGWANRLTGRTMGDHMEETAKAWRISREAQEDWALKSHQRAVAGWNGLQKEFHDRGFVLVGVVVEALLDVGCDVLGLINGVPGEVLDGLADLLHLGRDLVEDALGLELLVAGGVAERLLGLATQILSLVADVVIDAHVQVLSSGIRTAPP